mmetsp:Transcript_27396/g.24278  ORF Transcript_27396/g.24278 Transcript_27396/m.24278 type:complete len:184 (-) Transcript_27396:130-681(-)
MKNNTTTRQLKKLTKRISSVSHSRDGVPLTTRNFTNPSSRKQFEKRNIDDQINLKLSEEETISENKDDYKRKGNGRSKTRYNNKPPKFARGDSPKYIRMLGKYVEEQEVVMTKPSTQSYKGSMLNTSIVKHAVADLGNDSNDYSEDMEESVAFSKVCNSDKENLEMKKPTRLRSPQLIAPKRP